MDHRLILHNPGFLREVYDWIDDRYGPIKRILPIHLLPPEPRWWIYTCDLARAPVGTWFSQAHFGASGASVDPNEALRRALGEAVERYSAMNARGSQADTYYPPADMEISDRFPACAPNEPSSKRFKGLRNVTEPVPHVTVRRLSNDSSESIPSAYIYPTPPPASDGPLVTLPISTGLAFQRDVHNAIWRGLLEVIERDAMMLMWWTSKRVPEIKFYDSEIPEIVDTRIERLRTANLAARMFDITSDIRMPTVFCVITGAQYPYFTVGASTHEDPAVACSKAIDEATSIRVSVRFDKWSNDVSTRENFDWVQRLEHHMLLYADWPRSPAFAFLLEQNQLRISFDEFAANVRWRCPQNLEELASYAAQLESDGLSVLWTDVTAPEAANLGTVAKVIVPEAVPLSQDHRVRWLGTPRLLGAAHLSKAGISDFNPYPHPFA